MRNALQKQLFAAYYPYCSFLNRILPTITLDGKRLRILPGIYKPLDSEHGVVDFIEPGKRVLDMGCGSGVLTVFAALKSEHVTAVDISPQAIKNTLLNCLTLGLENVTVLASDMYTVVQNERFDYIISYPPLFEHSFTSSDQQWCTSNHFVKDLFSGAKDHLTDDGRLVVLLPAAFRDSPQEFAEENGLVLVSATPHSSRSLSTRLHSIPYLHFNMNNHVFVFARG